MNKGYMPLGVAVFLVVGGLMFSFLLLPQNGVVEGKNGLSGVVLVPSAHGAEVDNDAALNVQDASFFAVTSKEGNGNSGKAGSSYSSDKAMLQDTGASFAASENRSEVLKYITQKRDTLSSIASYFGLSKETILAANLNVRTNGIRPSEVITILPTSGVLYTTQIGDTLTSIANIFNASEDDLLKYNPSINFSSLKPGALVMVPNDGAARAALVGVGQ
jgi:LysM repeat protein